MSSAMTGIHMDVTDKMEAHRLRQMEKDRIHNRVILSGTKVAAATGTTAIITHLLATRYSPFYARLQTSFKVFLISSAFMAGFFTETDRAAMREDRAFMQKFSISKDDDVKYALEKPSASLWDRQALQEAFVKNRYKVVGYSYAGIVGATLVYNFARKDIPTPQKWINARMTGQLGAIAGMALAAWVTSLTPKKTDEHLDPYYERIVNSKTVKVSSGELPHPHLPAVPTH
ncbi:hypothetical protein HDV05_006153 [Chytridiales sp. JEL 0842]|nr:hypothetical protein HDV05_006153 [Chytridiales sp. JEL 0842]